MFHCSEGRDGSNPRWRGREGRRGKGESYGSRERERVRSFD